jgi:formylglycine-generating enzyme required for sulfatase activity
MHTIPELASPQSWQSTLPSRRAEIAQAILEGLPRGFEFAKPFLSTELAEVGGAAREVPCFYDAQHETTLTLVLGSDFTYGATAQRLATLRGLIPAEDWSLIAPVVHAAQEAGPVHVPAFLMGRFPTFEWVIEEHVELCDGLERPDFSSEDGPFPAYVTQEEAQRFLAATGHRLPWDHEWEYVAKAGTERLYVCGDAVPQRDLSGDVCLTQFGDGRLNRAAANSWGMAALAVATFTRLQASPHEWRIRGGAAAFYPFQHPMQQAMLLTELQLPLANMPGQMAGLRLCLDVPAI